MDIGALRALVRHALAGIDYTNLDDHAAFPGRTSTSERLAAFLADRMAEAIAKLPADARPIQPSVLRIRLRESPNAWAGYERPLP
jgi:6-pyruvoyltetrahydropterin/6-carboxytetrahydropterin synthase